MIRILLAVILVAGVLSLGCSGSTDANPPPDKSGGKAKLPPGIKTKGGAGGGTAVVPQ